MELLHHYTTSTYHTLRSDAVQRTVWQMSVCEVGFSHEFVLRGILAIAALHLAHLRPSRKEFYIARGMMHHQLGLRMATGLLPAMNEENCTPLCVFAALAVMFAMASPRTPEDFLLVNDKGLADWMILMRGMNSILDSSEPNLFAGPLGLMFQSGHRRFQLRSSEPFMLGSPHDDQVLLLQQRILDSCVDPERGNAYMGALAEVRKSLTVLFAYAETYEGSDAFIWVFRTPEEYFVLLREQDQSALCIFAFFCVSLHRLSGHWWAHGWSIHLMSQIYRLVDEEHRWWIQWPIDQIGGLRALQDFS
ncbi:hypothetical protein OIDMADRAFT_159751 [Oidiodendron maius Zn]|uniref:Transcription factor domain-containing protein n=1 Tax=Oidiodendron maius (strain Zn) TaxID=913774 RepID=A0A0C3DQK2_OIDMZ|nr:hypothetical protein OIDMADRAFT_159751 [Oidiodendron maius Zn]